MRQSPGDTLVDGVDGGEAAIGEADQRHPRHVDPGPGTQPGQRGVGVGRDHGLGDGEEPVDIAGGEVAAGAEAVHDQRRHALGRELAGIGRLARLEHAARAVQQHHGWHRPPGRGTGRSEERCGGGDRFGVRHLRRGEGAAARELHRQAGFGAGLGPALRQGLRGSSGYGEQGDREDRCTHQPAPAR